MSFDESPQHIESVVLESAVGMRVTVLNLGALVQSIEIPTAAGAVNVVLGLANHEEYLSDPNFMGTTIGRFANRIRDARFLLDGTNYQLDANERSTGHCLHGGARGFHQQLWMLKPASDRQSVACRYLSPDGDGGFPGNLEVNVDYRIVDDQTLTIDYRATTDRNTVVSLANHAYFNLDRDKSTIDTHYISTNAGGYLPTDNTQIPTGEVRNVCSTRFDLQRLTPLRIADKSLRLDHYFVLPDCGGKMQRAAELFSPQTGIRLRLQTTQPGLQLYTGEHLAPPFRARQGLCLETHAYPDAPNQDNFPLARLAASELYHHRTVYEFELETPVSR